METTNNTITVTPLFGLLTAALFGIAFMMLIFFTGCKKDEPQGNNKPITVQCQAQGIAVQPLTKSWSISDWIFNYNPNQYELKFTGTHGNVYTYSKSIAELQTGFEITILPDTYNVTYQSEHTPESGSLLSKKLDIKINDAVTINTNTPVVLKANNDDFLIIVDINNITQAEVMKNGFPYNMFNSPDLTKTFKYAYYNEIGDVTIRYWNGGQNYIKTISNAQLNNIYHMLSTFNGSTNINILPFDYNVIGW